MFAWGLCILGPQLISIIFYFELFSMLIIITAVEPQIFNKINKDLTADL